LRFTWNDLQRCEIARKSSFKVSSGSEFLLVTAKIICNTAHFLHVRYGAESLNVGNPSQITADPMTAINEEKKKKDKTLSRIVLHRAMAYTSFFFLTWTGVVIYSGVDLAGASWPIELSFVTNIFNPLQGVFNFIIFVYPKVGAAKSRGGVGTTWIKAFASVLWSTEIKQTNNQKKEPPIKVNKAQTTSTPTIPTPHLKQKTS
jgi:hypothetical protein